MSNMTQRHHLYGACITVVDWDRWQAFKYQLTLSELTGTSRAALSSLPIPASGYLHQSGGRWFVEGISLPGSITKIDQALRYILEVNVAYITGFFAGSSHMEEKILSCLSRMADIPLSSKIARLKKRLHELESQASVDHSWQQSS